MFPALGTSKAVTISFITCCFQDHYVGCNCKVQEKENYWTIFQINLKKITLIPIPNLWPPVDNVIILAIQWFNIWQICNEWAVIWQLHSCLAFVVMKTQRTDPIVCTSNSKWTHWQTGTQLYSVVTEIWNVPIRGLWGQKVKRMLLLQAVGDLWP